MFDNPGAPFKMNKFFEAHRQNDMKPTAVPFAVSLKTMKESQQELRGRTNVYSCTKKEVEIINNLEDEEAEIIKNIEDQETKRRVARLKEASLSIFPLPQFISFFFMCLFFLACFCP